MQKRDDWGHKSVKRQPRTDLGTTQSTQTCQPCLRENTAELTLCMDTSELRENRERALDTLLFSPSCHGDRVPAALLCQKLLFKQPTPYFSGLNHVFLHNTYDLKLTKFIHSQIYFLFFIFLLSASQCSIYIVDHLNEPRVQMPRPLLRINNAFHT